MKIISTAAFAVAITAFLIACTPLAHAQTEEEVPVPLKGWTVISEEGDGEYTPEELYRLGEESYEAGEYESARDRFETALEGLDDNDMRARCYERLAFVYAAFGLSEEVYDAFAESLRLDSSLVLDPEVVSPKVYEFYARARNDIVREGILVVNSDPPGAMVYLDGEPVGEAPVKAEHVAVGEYLLKVVKRGYETSSDTVAIKKDVTLTVDEKLARARGVLRVTSSPENVSVSIDGIQAGVTPVVLEHVSGGEHKLTLSRPNFEPYEAAVSLQKSDEISHHAVLTRRVLVIPVDMVASGAVRELIAPALSSISGVKLMYTDMDELKLDLASRGLSGGSVDFLGRCKRCLELGETAVISGLLEGSHAELAVVVSHAPSVDEEGAPTETLMIALYSTASELADVITYSSHERSELSRGVWKFVDSWNRAGKTDESVYGLRTVDRAGGTVQVLDVLPGYPAAEAGVGPGVDITGVDGAEVSGSAELARLMASGGRHEVSLKDGIKPARKVGLEPVTVPAEVPPDSGAYLYNLALVDLVAYLDATTPEGGRKATGDDLGYAALNLGNVYRRFGMLDKALSSYSLAKTSRSSGICTGTAVFRMAEAYEKKGLWNEAANAYRRCMVLYPDATLADSRGPRVSDIALERIKRLYRLGLLREMWWL